MKIAVVFLAFVALATSAEIIQPYAARSISSSIVKAIEDIREQMPCGFPDLGIPPIAPLKIPHKEVAIDYPAFQMHGSVDNFRLNGLNDFEIADMKVNVVLSKVNFRFIFNNVNVDTLYDLKVLLKKAGFTINLVGNGPAKFAIKNMEIWGTIKYSLGLVSRKLKLKTFEFRTHIGDCESKLEGILGQGQINEKMNDVIAEAVETVINENEDPICKTIEAAVVPRVNAVLDQYTLTELIGIIGGGKGGEGGEDEKEACIPPEF